MFEKLQLLAEKYDEISNLLADPELYSDPARLASLQKEHKELSEIVELYREYLSAESQANDAEELISEGDPEMRELAKEEYKICRDKMDELTENRLFRFIGTDHKEKQENLSDSVQKRQ